MSTSTSTAAPSINGSNRPARAAKAKQTALMARIVNATKKSKKGRKAPKSKKVSIRGQQNENSRSSANTATQNEDNVNQEPSESEQREQEPEDLTIDENTDFQMDNNAGQHTVSADLNQQYLDFVNTFTPSQPTMGSANLNLAQSRIYPTVPPLQTQAGISEVNTLGTGQEWTTPYFMETGYVQQAITDPLANETQKALLGYALHPKAVENHIQYGRNRPNVPIAVLQAIAHGKFVDLEKVIHDPAIPFDGENTLRVNDAGQLSTTMQKKYSPIRNSVELHYALSLLAQAYAFLFPGRRQEFTDYIQSLLALEFSGIPLTSILLYDRALRNKVASQRHLTLYYKDEELKARYLYNTVRRNPAQPQRNQPYARPEQAKRLTLPPRQTNKADEVCALHADGRCTTNMAEYKPTGCRFGRKHVDKTDKAE